MRLAWSGGMLVAALALGGCGGSTPAACNALVDDGPVVTATEVAAAAPAITGGTIADGTYTLTALTAYTGAGGPRGDLALTASEVQTISGTTIQEVGEINGQAKRYTTTISTLDMTGSFSTSDTCPAPGGGTHRYTATAVDLRIYDLESGFTLESVYTRRDADGRLLTDLDATTATNGDGARE